MDLTILQFLAAPFVASLILAGIHAYLGVHVVERGVIFVDLSLAQIAALGATIALLLPISYGDPHSGSVYWISLAFTFIGAAIFSTIRVRKARIPQEAIIGICYAVASAASILAMSKATSESEHLKDMLVGNILAVSWWEVGKTAALYAVIGLFHFVFRGKFLDRLRQAYEAGKLSCSGKLARLTEPGEFQRLLAQCYQTDWVVYAKPPFGGPTQVLKYLARYTHRVAISNGRLLGMEFLGIL